MTEQVRIHLETDIERACVRVLLEERKIPYEYHYFKDNGTLEHWFSVPTDQYPHELHAQLTTDYGITRVENVSDNA